jgi:hypothetical protein
MGSTPGAQPGHQALKAIGVSVDAEVVRSLTSEVIQAFGPLLPQLPGSAEALDPEALHRLVDWPGNQLLLSRVDGEIRLRVWIVDVVVDEAARGRGAGAALRRRR